MHQSDLNRAEALKLRNYTVELEGNVTDLKMSLSAKADHISRLREDWENVQVCKCPNRLE